MHDPDGIDLKNLENDIEALDERIKDLESRKVLLPWQAKELSRLKEMHSEKTWEKISAQEIVHANIHQTAIHDHLAQQPPLSHEEKLNRVAELQKARALKIKMGKIKR